MPKADHNAPAPPRSRRSVITMAGVLFGLTSLFLAIGAVNGQNNLLFWAFGLALGGMLVSGVLSGAGMMGLRVRRRVPAQARAGEAFTITYDLANTNRLVPLFCVTLVEQPGDSTTLDRPATGFAPRVAPRQSARATVRAIPASRGRLTLERLSASSSFPLGLIRKVMDFDSRASLLVLPARLRLRDSLVPRPARSGHGGAASPTGLGHGDEFFGVRAYVPGDSPRLIAWRPSARSEDLIVRQQGTPPPIIAWVVLDFDPNAPALQFERAIALAGAALELFEQRGCSVGLLCESLGIARAPAPGRWHVQRLLTLLASLNARPVPSPPPDRAASGRIRREHAVVLVRADDPDAAPAMSTGAPHWATTLRSTRIRDYLAEGFNLPAILDEPPAPESRQDRIRRLMREFFLVDPVGETAMDGAAPVPTPQRSTRSGAASPPSPRFRAPPAPPPKHAPTTDATESAPAKGRAP